MMLLIDIGNSRIKWAVWDGTALQPGGAHGHEGDAAAMLEQLDLPRADAVWISEVLNVQPALSETLLRRFGAAPQFAHTLPEWNGLHIAYAEPRRLGVDRWLAMVALWNERRSAFCVANAGTALTFDAVDDHGRHLGGLISPGLATAQKAVLGATRFGATPDMNHYSDGLGQDTESCVRQGALHAGAGLIERAARLGHGPCFLSGGDAHHLQPHLPEGWILRPQLVLEGLLALARGGQLSF
jgi:type III pantothenate kinase